VDRRRAQGLIGRAAPQVSRSRETARSNAGVVSGSDDFNVLADDLESLRAGQLSEGEFRAKYERRAAPAVVRTIWPNLEHYLSDGDIRARDPGYRAMQDIELTKLQEARRRFSRSGDGVRRSTLDDISGCRSLNG